MNTSRFGAGLLAAAALVCLPAVCSAAVDAPSQRVIDQSGKALGISALAHVRVIHVEASVDALGLKGSGSQWLGLTDGRFAESTVLTPFVQDDGYDGRVAWNRDRSGVVWNDGSDAGLSSEINNAYTSDYALWKPNASGARVSFAGERSEKGRAYDVLHVLPAKSKVAFDLWFDKATHLPRRQIQTIGSTTNATILSGYRPEHGLQIAHDVHIDNTQGNNSDATVTRVEFDPAGAGSHLARPQSTVKDFSMNGGATSTTIPFRLVENHVYLDVMLNGKGPYRFIFDTGGQNVVDPAVAKEIGAFGKGSVQGQGVGNDTEGLSFGIVDRLQVGDAVLADQLFAVAPVRMGFGISGGQPADGLIGWEVLARYVTAFNYSNDTVVLTMPQAARTPARAQVLPFVFNGTQPQIACGIDGIASQCTIDTGARDTMSFYRPYLEAHPQVIPATQTANGITGFGFGGPAYGRLGRVGAVTLGNLTMHDLVADFSTQTGGAMVAPFSAANLGGNLLRRFDITFDYGNETMALVPNASFSQPDSYERAGLFLVRKDGKTIVADARPGTPASDAGMVKGDVLTTIDGTPTSGMSLEEVRAFFLRPAGTSVRLGVTAKDGTERALSLTLRDYV